MLAGVAFLASSAFLAAGLLASAFFAGSAFVAVAFGASLFLAGSAFVAAAFLAGVAFLASSAFFVVVAFISVVVFFTASFLTGAASTVFFTVVDSFATVFVAGVFFTGILKPSSGYRVIIPFSFLILKYTRSFYFLQLFKLLKQVIHRNIFINKETENLLINKGNLRFLLDFNC